MKRRGLSLFKGNRGQAATEFLMIYGWAILATIFIIAALAYYGIFNPDSYNSGMCSINEPLVCYEYIVGNDGVRIVVLNGVLSPINITDYNIVGCGASDRTPIRVLREGFADISIPCDTGYPGDEFNARIEINYTRDDKAYDERTTGYIWSEVRDIGMGEGGPSYPSCVGDTVDCEGWVNNSCGTGGNLGEINQTRYCIEGCGGYDLQRWVDDVGCASGCTSEAVDCGNWVNESCGIGEDFDMRIQTRDCSGCSWPEQQLVYDVSCSISSMFGLVAHYKFDESNGTFAEDSSGNGNHGTLNNFDATPSWNPLGKIGTGALEFDGLDDLVEVPMSESLSLEYGDFSISTWIYALSEEDHKFFIDNEGYDKGYFCGLKHNLRVFCRLDGSGDSVDIESGPSGTNQLSMGDWYHVVIVADRDGNATIYVNGTSWGEPEDISEVGNITTHSRNLTIGQGDWGSGPTGGLFNGSLDDVRIYNRTLSFDEIQYLYDVGGPPECLESVNCTGWVDNYCGTGVNLNRLYKTRTCDAGCGYNEQAWVYDASCSILGGLAAYYRFDEMSGNVAKDSSGNENHGSLFNGPQWNSAGKICGTLNFDSFNNQSVEVLNSPSLSFGNSTDFSVSAWIYTLPTIEDDAFFLDFSRNGGFFLRVKHMNDVPSNQRIALRIGDDVTNRIDLQSPTQSIGSLIGGWHHVVVVADRDGNASIYFNGTSHGSMSISHVRNITDSNANLTIGQGGWYGNLGYPFNGSIDEVRIYNRTLSGAEIQYLFEMGLSPADCIAMDALSYWKFNGNALDERGNHNGINVVDVNWTSGSRPGTLGAHMGDSGHIDVGNFSLQGNESTAVAWFKIDGWSLGHWRRILTKSSTCESRQHDFLLGITDESPQSEWHYRLRTDTTGQRPNSWESLSNTTPIDGEWIFGAVVHNGTDMIIYDGNESSGIVKFVNSTQQDGDYVDNPTKPFWIGNCPPSSTDSSIGGTIDDLMLFERALSITELQILLDYFNS